MANKIANKFLHSKLFERVEPKGGIARGDKVE